MNVFNRRTRILTSLLLFANSYALIAQTNVSNSIFTLPAGAEISARMDNEINSKVSSAGDTFTATVDKPLSIRGVEILPVGAIIEGRITSVNSAAGGRKDGNFKVKFETLQMADGTKRRIDADLLEPKKYRSKSSAVFTPAAILGGAAAGAILGAFFGKARGALIGAGAGAGAGTTAALLKKGAQAQIKANESFVIKLNREVVLPVEDF